MSKRGLTSLQFFGRLKWLDGRPLLDGIEQYRREIFRQALDTFDARGRPLYSMVLSGRGKKNSKSLDLILAALFVLVIRRSVQGSDGYILANDQAQASDDLSLAKKLVQCNPDLASEIEVLANELRLKDGSATLKVLPSRDTVGVHGKSAAFVGWDEIHGYRDWSLMEALQPDPTRPDTLQWVTSYASLYASRGAPLHDLMEIGKAGKDPRMLFSWYSGDYCTDPAFAELPPELRANPSMASWPEGQQYIETQRLRLPSGRFRRLHLNLPGSPEGSAFDQAAVLRCVVTGRTKIPFEEGRQYVAAVDMSGGSSDNAVLSIMHRDGAHYVQDVLIKQQGSPPFNPRAAINQFCDVLEKYGINRVYGDAFAGQTFRLDFQARGVTYEMRGTSASDLYEKFEPILNAGEIELLDNPSLIEELVSLIWKGNKITHEPGGHDDHANSVALAVSVLRDSSAMLSLKNAYGPYLGAVSGLGAYANYPGYASPAQEGHDRSGSLAW